MLFMGLVLADSTDHTTILTLFIQTDQINDLVMSGTYKFSECGAVRQSHIRWNDKRF